MLDLLSVMALAVVIALAIGASAQTRFGKDALIHLALLAQCDFGFEGIDLACQHFRHLICEFVFPK